MALHLPAGSTLSGIAISKFQKLLREHCYWDYRRDSSSEMELRFDLADINMSCPDTFQMMSLLAARGFVEPCSYKTGADTVMRLTEAGAVLREARLRKRVPLAKADKAFEGLKEGIERLNAEGLRKVTEVWIFGSYMLRQSEVGGIDCGIVTQFVGSWQEMEAGIRDRYAGERWHNASMRRYGGSYVDGDYDRHMIFGGRKPAILEGTRVGGADHQAGMPCQRVYTAEHGWHAEPILPMHPSADTPLKRTPVTLHTDQGAYSNLNETPQVLASTNHDLGATNAPKQAQSPVRRDAKLLERA